MKSPQSPLGTTPSLGTSPSLAPWLQPGRLEAGCDEAGRGCLAGPVVAAAVILEGEVALDLACKQVLNDSKQMPESLRDALRMEIESRALAWAVAFIDPEEIDRINILQASFAAMRNAVRSLNPVPEHLLIDGNRFVTERGLPPHTCLVRGDARFASIAAASVLAKTHRDAYMRDADRDHPGYGWAQNMGYPTAAHRQAIRTLGLTPLHRVTFRQLPETPRLF